MRVKWLRGLGVALLISYAAAMMHEVLPRHAGHEGRDGCALCALFAAGALAAVAAGAFFRAPQAGLVPLPRPRDGGRARWSSPSLRGPPGRRAL